MVSVAAGARSKAFLHEVRPEFAAAKGKREDAFAALADAVENGLVDLLWMDGCPALRDLRADARFQPLRSQVEVRAALVHVSLSRTSSV